MVLEAVGLAAITLLCGAATAACGPIAFVEEGDSIVVDVRE